ncbi:PAS domain-containing protein [Streptomyces gobiensis]|uniref:PAS domain-containing protein n=1 Tax=Streptomyces gobiensis TaxID=2875706 RepID=UPI001E3424B6|nr:PAS domain-containing protein [Streptomyces gobiensis]UGY94391.1 PAS domain-containing protein [Streptomyces gobiensis]
MAESAGVEPQRRGPGRGSSDEQHLQRALFQRLPLPVALLDRDTVVRRLNHAAAQVFGMREGYASGRGLAGALAHDQRAAFRAQVAAVARGEGERSLMVRLLRSPERGAQGSGPELRTTLTPLRPPREPHTAVLAVFQQATAPPPRPVTPDVPLVDPRTARPDLAEATRNTELLDLFDDMAAALISAKTAQAVADSVGTVLHNRFADWVIIDLALPGGELERTAVFASSATVVRTAVAKQSPDECPLVVDAVQHGMEALQVRPEDPEALGRDASGSAVLARAEVSSLLCVPLRTGLGGPPLGALTLLRSGGRLAFALAEAGVIDRIARHIALALHRL